MISTFAHFVAALPLRATPQTDVVEQLLKLRDAAYYEHVGNLPSDHVEEEKEDMGHGPSSTNLHRI